MSKQRTGNNGNYTTDRIAVLHRKWGIAKALYAEADAAKVEADCYVHFLKRVEKVSSVELSKQLQLTVRGIDKIVQRIDRKLKKSKVTVGVKGGESK